MSNIKIKCLPEHWKFNFLVSLMVDHKYMPTDKHWYKAK